MINFKDSHGNISILLSWFNALCALDRNKTMCRDRQALPMHYLNVASLYNEYRHVPL